MASKIIVIGNVNCQLQDVFTKLAKLQAKQNFSLAIVAGDLFGECATDDELQEMTALLQGNILVPLPTYFTLGSRPLPARVVEKIQADDEVCPNLFFLGKRGTLKTSEGIRIVALGGNLEEGNKSTDKFHPGYTESDARTLYGAHSADILLTHQWPKGIRSGSKVPLPDDITTPQETQCIADLCATLKPRYHLSCTETFFYEREPFFHLPSEDSDNPDAKPLTRFISLASYSKTAKQKWMYAFTFDPQSPHPLGIPAGATISPFSSTASKRKPLASQSQSYQRFAVDDNTQRPRKRAARAPPPGPEQCFFCLSNPNIATHLITSIGNESYLTTAKGPLPTASTFSPAVNFPGHMLIIPFNHAPALNTITDPDARISTFTEMTKYRTALQTMLQTRSNHTLGAVTWEVSRGNGIHAHWQFLPVPADLVNRGLVDAAFKVEAENLKYPKFETLSTSASSSKNTDHDHDPSAEPGDFFRIWIWSPSPSPVPVSSPPPPPPPPPPPSPPPGQEKRNSKGSEKTLLLPLGPDFRFDLQFGRRVVAKLMELERRIHWKDAVQSLEEEEADAGAFKEAFKGFDFTLEEDGEDAK
ncbi:hypothetical protein P175DRAFT_0478703 [Aspergillus ochraceoroseus IBT 24754]|uniref:Cwf19-like C-terminal domain-containing protein n=1 Tax=Aspergillus ochraceoroseus IBT 24754 TaxID=1392256 RepID=A0A2T5LWI9_9EURO|nr:uncharacterized protein P175DRAFT_0478703 [Aspergillus ochraceoroseus IBT 24754]PTU20651.1 hypothetical protein P175DRAFT_0478703 [Aspergillus ochraceoroseus IBT 24754]